MKANIRDHIEQLDLRSGGAIISDKNRINTIDSPMLVIGLGGTGIDALLRVKHSVSRKFKLEKDSMKPHNIEYLAFETNKTDLEKNYKGTRLDEHKEFVDLSNADIGTHLKNRKTMPAFINEWLNPELTNIEGVKGASGNRQAGRLLLFTKAHKVINVLQKKIESLKTGTSDKLIVFVLGGLSGGTGSGTFLDIPYIIQQIVETNDNGGSHDRLEIFGYMFTPDVNLARVGGGIQAERIKKNGYAALKELDFWMSISDRKDFFTQQYTNTFKVHSDLPPYTFCHLISATNEAGKLLNNAYDYSLNVAAENITNFMANEEKSAGQDFAIHDYISNAPQLVKDIHKDYQANYNYAIVGAASANLPIEEITSYVAYEVFNRMDKMFRNTPTKEEIKQFVHKTLRFDLSSLERELNTGLGEPIPGFAENNESSVLKKGAVRVDETLEREYLAGAKAKYDATARDYPEKLEKLVKKALTDIFINPKFGPFYTSRLIVNNTGESTLSYIEEMEDDLQIEIDKVSRAIKSDENGVNRAFAIFVNKKSFLFLDDKKEKENFVNASKKLYKNKARLEALYVIQGLYGELRSILREQAHNIYNVIVEVLEGLNRIFKENASILTEGNEETDSSGNKTYYWNIIEIPEMVKTIKRIMNNQSDQEIITSFTEKLLKDMNRWTLDEELDINSSIAEFLDNSFGQIINEEMENFLKMIFGEERQLDKYINEMIAPRLANDAVPVFNMRNRGNEFPSHSIISIPKGSNLIEKGIKEYTKNDQNENAKTSVHQSDLKNRIFWLNIKNGVPLYLYNQLINFEEAYERSVKHDDFPGRHLCQSEKENWLYLPSPIPEESWGDRHQNERVKSQNDKNKKLFDLALEYGVVFDKGEGENPRYGYNFLKDFTEEASAVQDGITHEDDYELLKEQYNKLLLYKNRLTSAPEYLEEKRNIHNSSSLQIAKINFARLGPKILNRISEEIGKFEPLMEALRELESKIANMEKAQRDIEEERAKVRELSTLLLEALYTNTIVKKGALYQFDKEAEEDAWEPFANIMQVSKYIEFEIYHNLRKLDDRKMDQLTRKVKKRSEAILEDYGLLTEKLTKLGEEFEKTKLELDHSRDEMNNGEKIYIFYQEMLNKVKEILNALKVVN
ncbi:tubulin-like doman-containing protein [Mesobacillus jeotgali]|uniref:tubulin-like doman-containing protein n=1 Tax=Mesobacillus jeotgali TaxID=129985 RepID=UPI001CFC5232|nr:tubulin-like doman-containing protein [Mesobacillus jeotgali]